MDYCEKNHCGSTSSSAMSSSLKGSCVICGTPATTKCGSCRREFYCAKEHQRIDWPRHRSACRPFEICQNEQLGRHLLATRDLAAGQLILSEAPLVWGPVAHTEERVCVGCGEKAAVCRCPNCCWPACRLSCSGLVDKSRHGTECEILAKARLLPRCGYLLVLRVLLMRFKQPKQWQLLAKLQSHEAKRGPGTEAYDEMQNLIRYLNPLLSKDNDFNKVLPKVCGLVDVNALETNPPEGSSALYENACLMEHRCIANTRHSFELDDKGRPKISVFAVTPIKKGDHISTTYTHVLWSTRVRREHLLATKYFTCCCERCADPTELNSNLGTIKCPCKKGYVTPSKPLDPDSDWTCDSCPGTLSSEEVIQLTDRLAEEVEGAMTVPVKEVLTDLLRRLTILLHPCHQHCITIGHSLLQLLSNDDPKKVELCQRMLDTIAIVDPHEIRLTLYQAIAYREMSMCTNQDKNSLLLRAIEVLQYEPPKSSGDVLSNIILSEI